jgi:hypothetical protein
LADITIAGDTGGAVDVSDWQPEFRITPSTKAANGIAL